MENITLINGDCLDELKNIKDKSINLVVMDPPYNIKKEKEWDDFGTKENYIEFMGKVFLECQRVLKDNGAMYFFHNDMEQISLLMEWIKTNTNFKYNSFIVLNKVDNNRALVWKNPSDKSTLRSWFNTCEYLLYYIKTDGSSNWDSTGLKLITNNFYPLRKYAYDLLCYIGGGKPKSNKYIEKKLGNRKAEHFFYCGKKKIKEMIKWGGIDHFTRYGSSQWSLPTKETYTQLTEIFNLRDWENYRTYESLRAEYESLRYVHNLDNNHNNVWNFKRDKGKNYHSCQKPIDILERIIKCSSNENDVILDCFMGSGSTGIAAKHLNRKFIGIERDETYFNIAEQRIEEE